MFSCHISVANVKKYGIWPKGRETRDGGREDEREGRKEADEQAAGGGGKALRLLLLLHWVSLSLSLPVPTI